MTIKEILQAPESRTLEFKREIPKNRRNILKTIIAFANGSGGTIYIGVNDDRSVCGIQEEPFELEESLSSLIYDAISPTPGIFYQTTSVDDKLVFVLKVLPGANKPYFLRKLGPAAGSFIRVGSTNRLADDHILAELKRQARNISFDDEVENSFKCHILDKKVLKIFLSWRGLEIKPSIQYFIKNRLAHRYDHTCHPTIGGLLLFCSHLPDTYEYAGFQVSCFKNDSRADLIHSELVSSGLLLMPDKITELSLLYLAKGIQIDGLRRKETYDIPIFALREAILNAICHRDYSIAGASCKLDIFTDRVEITSPGVLPTGITLQDLGFGTSEIRNRRIVKIFRQAGFVEQLGTGIIRMREACRRDALPAPKFEEIGSFFKVTLFRPQHALPDDLQQVFNLLKVHGLMGSREIAEKSGFHQNTVLKRLKKLEAKGLIIKQGSGTKVRYGL
jgi:ATP-dependent DNA helicase RecG